MNLAERIKIILSENNLNQKQFAKSINVTESYISKLLRNESGLSNSTATLIKEIYGYSLEWILNGAEPKMSKKGKTKNITPLQRKIISSVEQMDSGDLAAVMSFINTLEEYKENLAIIESKERNIETLKRIARKRYPVSSSSNMEMIEEDLDALQKELENIKPIKNL